MANNDRRTCSTPLGSSRKHKPKPLEQLKQRDCSAVFAELVEAVKVPYIVGRHVKRCNHFGR